MPDLFRTVDYWLPHARRMAIGGVLAALVIAVAGLVPSREWASTSSFLPQSRRAQSSLSALAAQFGVAAPNLEGQPTPQFYADFLTSDELLRRLANAKLDTGTGPRVSLAAALDVAHEDSARTEESTVRKLESRMESDVGPKNGLVSLRTRMPSARLAYAVNRAALDLLVDFNLTTRRSQAGAERRFTEERVQAAGAELRAAEDRQRDFMRRNREIGFSADLALEKERLSREVLMRQQLYTTLMQSFEQARIDEVRDTPTITIVEDPHIPARPLSRHLLTRAVLAFVIGALLGYVWGLVVAFRAVAHMPARPGPIPSLPDPVWHRHHAEQ